MSDALHVRLQTQPLTVVTSSGTDKAGTRHASVWARLWYTEIPEAKFRGYLYHADFSFFTKWPFMSLEFSE